MLQRMRRLLIVATMALLAGCVRFERSGPPEHQTRSIELDKSEMVSVEINMGVGELRVEGGSPRLMDADFDYNVAGWKPVVRYDASSFRGKLTVSQPPGFSGDGHATYKWNLKLNDGVPLDLTAHLGAGEARLDLGSLTLRSVEVHMGVGELHMDLRGSPKRDYSVQIHGGVGSATVHLPHDVGVDARATGGIGDINAQGLEKRDGRWVNPSLEHAPVTIHLDVSGGVGDITLIAD